MKLKSIIFNIKTLYSEFDIVIYVWLNEYVYYPLVKTRPYVYTDIHLNFYFYYNTVKKDVLFVHT